MSFDVKSLFTSISLQQALDFTENAIKNSTVELPLPTDDIMDLPNLCLTSTFFQYNGNFVTSTFPTGYEALKASAGRLNLRMVQTAQLLD